VDVKEQRCTGCTDGLKVSVDPSQSLLIASE
jgi:hypothetical protein